MDFLVLCPGNVKNKTDEKAQKKRGRNHVTRLINKEGTGITMCLSHCFIGCQMNKIDKSKNYLKSNNHK